MSPPTQRRSGSAPTRVEPAPEITSHRQEVGIETETSGSRGQCTASVAELPDAPVPFPYGYDYPDTDLWVDRDGRVHRGDGPYLNRPLRRLRRAIRQWWLR